MTSIQSCRKASDITWLRRTCKLACQAQTSCQPIQRRHLQSSSVKPATPIPHPMIPGGPPKAPVPQPSSNDERVARKKKNAELLERGRNLRANPTKPGTALRKRFWKDVTVKKTDEGYQIYLDSRPVRTPSKQILTIPLEKPHLATAIALEWDLLISAQQATKHTYIPMTSLTSRAMDIAHADAASDSRIRENIVKMTMRYLSTDTLLCWAPEKNMHDPDETERRRFVETSAGTAGTIIEGEPKKHRRGTSLRQQQEDAAKPLIAFLTTHVWPGVELNPVLSNDSLMPIPQPAGTNDVIRSWVQGLEAWDLAGLERACLASKSLCVAARFLVEWSGEHDPARWLEGGAAGPKRFTIEDAADACSQEVKWQTSMWGEVDDTHDVENADLRRQLGSVVLLVNGNAS